MDTLVLIQNDPKIDHALQQFPMQAPRRGKCLQIVKLPKTAKNTSSRTPAMNGAPLDLGIVSCMCKAIIQFTKARLERHLQKRKHLRIPMPTFQIILIFHQCHASVVNSITAGFMLIGNHPRWTELMSKYNQNYRIGNIWLLSCESEADPAMSHLELRKYFLQAISMRRSASIGLMTPFVIPDREEVTWLHPAIYTFSTGDTVHGSLTIHPNHVWFFEEQDYALRDMQIIETRGKQVSPKKPVAGKIYKHVEGQPLAICVVPRGQEVDLIRDPPSF